MQTLKRIRRIYLLYRHSKVTKNPYNNLIKSLQQWEEHFEDNKLVVTTEPKTFHLLI